MTKTPSLAKKKNKTSYNLQLFKEFLASEQEMRKLRKFLPPSCMNLFVLVLERKMVSITLLYIISLRAGSLNRQGRWSRNREPAKPARRMGRGKVTFPRPILLAGFAGSRLRLHRPCLSSEPARRLVYNKKEITLQLKDMNFMFLPLKHKIHMFSPSCNILQVFEELHSSVNCN